MNGDPDDSKKLLLDVLIRRVFDSAKDGGDSTLLSEWESICDDTLKSGDFATICSSELNEFVYMLIYLMLIENFSRIPSTSAECVTEWSSESFPPIEVVVDDADFEIYNQQPSTSSSVISAQQDSQQDTKVIQRIAELRSAGLWSSTRLPQCAEPQRKKSHWDYLLEEIIWMHTDFKQERRFKRKVGRKLASDAKTVWKRKFENKKDDEAERRKEAKRICGTIAKFIRDFWNGADKVADLRVQDIVKSRKRKMLNKHLNFLVGKADKLSTILQERLTNIENEQSASSKCSTTDKDVDEEEYDEDFSEEDDESTIALEEKRQNPVTVQAERNELEKEADMDLDDFISSLPPGYLELYTQGKQEKEGSSDRWQKSPEKLIGEEKTDHPDTSADFEQSKKNSAVEKDSVNALPSVDYAKLKSESSEVRKQELNNIAQAAMEFQPKGYTLETAQIKTEVPFLLNGTLREYQLVGLDWLVTLYEKNLNGILADEMGLGKTIQTIALLAHLACERCVWGPHLIIVPTSVILNWEIEFKKWCPSFKILTYFGTAKERAEKRKGWSKENAFHVCITSYKVVTQDVRAFKKKAWQYMILDEAQNIKNFKSQRWQTLLNVRSRRRLLLTGTPLQNSLMELWSLLHFLMPSVFASHEDFKDWFSNPLTNMVEGSVDMDRALVQRLHKVLRPFILRRLKSEVEKQLPTKQEKILRCALSKRQRFLYNEFLSRKATVDNLRSGNMMSVLNIIMQLRKCCNHPNLFEPRPVVSPLIVQPSKTQLSQQFLLDTSPDVTPRQFNTISSVAEWKLFSDVSNPQRLLDEAMNSSPQEVLRKIKGLKYAADSEFKSGSLYIEHSTETNGFLVPNDEKPKTNDVLKNGRKRRIGATDDDQNAENGEQQISAKRLRFDNVIQLNSIHQAKKEKNLQIIQWISQIPRLSGAPVLPLELISSVKREFGNVVDKSCIFSSKVGDIDFPVSNADLYDNACRIISLRISEWTSNAIRGFILYIHKLLLSDVSLEGPMLSVYDRYQKNMYDQFAASLFNHEPLPAHKVRLGHLLQFPELRLIEYDCGKLQKLALLLVQLHENKHRCLIFTQMSRMLDILQAFLSHHNYKYFRLDGTTPIDQRQAMMERFNSDDSVFCFILSTRSGGIGVNLTGADTVIFYDSDWNPTMDAQAQDRCHRIGQTRNVTIYRLISAKTIEENILQKAKQKQRLGEMAIDEAEFTPEFFRNADNIRDLFKNEEGIADIVNPLTSVPTNAKELEMAMANAEDQQDVIAAEHARAEAQVDDIEFDENASRPPSHSSNVPDAEDPSEEYIEMMNCLKPVEQYAVRFLESSYLPEIDEEMKAEEAMMEGKKEAFQKKMENEKPVKTPNQLIDDSFTYDPKMSIEEIFSTSDVFSFNPAPVWMPPSPPISEFGEDDNYVALEDFTLYEDGFIPDEDLPPIPVYVPTGPYHRIPKHLRRPSQKHRAQHIKVRGALTENGVAVRSRESSIGLNDYEGGRSRLQASTPGAIGARHGHPSGILSPPESAPATPSSHPQNGAPESAGSSSAIYDSAMVSVINGGGLPSQAALSADGHKMIDECIESVRRSSTVKKQPIKYMSYNVIGPHQTPHVVVRPSSGSVPDYGLEAPDYKGPPWTCAEDYRLLMAVTREQGLTTELVSTCVGLQINWDFVAHYVNQGSSHYRSPRQCCLRYRNAILRFDDIPDNSAMNKRNRRSSSSSSLDGVGRRQSNAPTTIYFDSEQRRRDMTGAFRGRAETTMKACIHRRSIYHSPLEMTTHLSAPSQIQPISLNAGISSQHLTRLNELGVTTPIQLLQPTDILQSKQVQRNSNFSSTSGMHRFQRQNKPG
ncbi:HSA domain-containing protein [Ditylenchus destructor]|uniref:HSA domain-containing protein n=1 Tax=Ditylenchus destructor TaxID=166010 RepID=A0AAD4NJD3_9BILA|nr:HSA domain-containing protein [Ditylenchus destructor]